jgi:N-acetylglucosaminyl-diphospho-decaprenol L-rhamnosyltransferase
MDHRTAAESSDGGPNLLIVIVCYRVAELTIACLRSIADQIHDVPGTRVFVCENGTGAESAEQLRQAIIAHGWSDWVSLRAISPNVGFTGGNNAILREAMSWAAPPKYFFLLNADTILQPDALKSLFSAIEHTPNVGVMGTTILGEDGQPQESCFRDHSPLSEFLRGAGTGLLNRFLWRKHFQLMPADGQLHYDWISFAAAVIRSSVIRDVGYLDEGYFLYYDDADFCRVARKSGWLIGFCPEARIIHLEGQSNEVPQSTRLLKRRPRYYYVSRARYFAKHYGAVGLWAANLAWSVGSIIAYAKWLVSKRTPACEHEWNDIWTNAFAPIRNSNASLIPEESHAIL